MNDHRTYARKGGDVTALSITPSTADGWRFDAKDGCFKKQCGSANTWKTFEHKRPVAAIEPLRMYHVSGEHSTSVYPIVDPKQREGWGIMPDEHAKLPPAPNKDQNALFAAKAQENAVRTSTAAYQRPPIEVTFSGRYRSPDVDEQWRKAVNDLFQQSAESINAKAVQGERHKRAKPSHLADHVHRQLDGGNQVPATTPRKFTIISVIASMERRESGCRRMSRSNRVFDSFFMADLGKAKTPDC